MPMSPGHKRRQPAPGAPSQRPGPRLVSTDSGLQAHGLSKTYNNRPVVRDVSITLQRGEAVGLLGPNGAGKTTTFYMVCGLVHADDGPKCGSGVVATCASRPSSAARTMARVWRIDMRSPTPKPPPDQPVLTSQHLTFWRAIFSPSILA